MADGRKRENIEAVTRLARSLLESDPECEVTFVAPQFFAADYAAALPADPRAASFFVPMPSPLPLRAYFQQTALPIFFRLRSVNQIVSFGQGVPVLYPAPRVFSVLPGQAKEWWKIVPGLMAADAVAVDSSRQKAALEGRVPKAGGKIRVVSPAVGHEFHPYPKDASKELLERHSVKGRYFLFLGPPRTSVSPALVTLEAFAKIAHRPRMKSVACVFASPSAPAVRRRVTELGIDHRVVFLDDVSLTDLPLWLSNAQFAVTADLDDDAPLALLRALASGCPVIAPGTVGIEAEMKSAVLPCHAADPKALAEAMTRLLADAELRDGLVKEGLEIASARSWTKRVDEFTSLFEADPAMDRLKSAPVSGQVFDS